MRRALCLVLLAGCSDPWAAGESGTWWHADASESLLSGHLMFQVRDADRLKLEEAGELALTRDQVEVVRKRLRADSTGRVFDSERFGVRTGGSVAVGDGKAFELKIRADAVPGGRVGLNSEFSWTGGMSLGSRLLLNAPEGRLYWRRRGGGRCEVVLLAFAAVAP